MPNLLITNDDGINAPGLRALVESLAGLGQITVVAPQDEQSGKAQSLTIRRPIYVEKIAANEWAVDGTPTDSIIIALNKLLPEKPDVVISGINCGGNLGENVYYSGTVGAAMEATINGIPAIAVSLAYKNADVSYARAAALARRMVEMVLEEGLPPGVLLNVNVPQSWNGNVFLTRQSKKVTRNLLRETQDPQGRTQFWLLEQKLHNGVEPDTDYAAIFADAVSVTPLRLDRTSDVSLNHLSHWARRLTARP